MKEAGDGGFHNSNDLRVRVNRLIAKGAAGARSEAGGHPEPPVRSAGAESWGSVRTDGSLTGTASASKKSGRKAALDRADVARTTAHRKCSARPSHDDDLCCCPTFLRAHSLDGRRPLSRAPAWHPWRLRRIPGADGVPTTGLRRQGHGANERGGPKAAPLALIITKPANQLPLIGQRSR
jgi:hypothetical protein